MKTINKIASAFILLALSVNYFALDNSDHDLSTIEMNEDIASTLMRYGRNSVLKGQTNLQFTEIQKNDAKGRNEERVDEKVTMY